MAVLNDTPQKPTPEALQVTYQEREDVSQWKVRRGRGVISGSQFKRLFKCSLQLLIWVINLLCASLMCHVTPSTCCFKCRLKVSYSLDRRLHPVGERPPWNWGRTFCFLFFFLFWGREIGGGIPLWCHRGMLKEQGIDTNLWAHLDIFFSFLF